MKEVRIRKELKKTLPFISEFFLHGSRGKLDSSYCVSSDYDFACQHEQPWQETYALLLEEEFVECVEKSYLDNDTAFVFEKEILGEKVQLSFRQNLNRYKNVWNSIGEDFYKQFLWKKSEACLPVDARKNFYNSLYYVWDCATYENSIS